MTRAQAQAVTTLAETDAEDFAALWLLVLRLRWRARMSRDTHGRWQ